MKWGELSDSTFNIQIKTSLRKGAKRRQNVPKPAKNLVRMGPSCYSSHRIFESEKVPTK